MIVLIDNYDSFSYNLYQLIGMLRPDIRVVRNDELTVPQVRDLKPSHIILSPDRDTRAMRASACRLRRNLANIPKCWVCAWGIRLSARRSGRLYPTQSS